MVAIFLYFLFMSYIQFFPEPLVFYYFLHYMAIISIMCYFTAHLLVINLRLYFLTICLVMCLNTLLFTTIQLITKCLHTVTMTWWVVTTVE